MSSGVSVPLFTPRGSGSAAASVTYAQVKDIKAANTAGGTFSSGAMRTRDLNQLTSNGAWASIGSNQITLEAGTYRIFATAPAFRVDRHKAILYNITAAATALDVDGNAIIGSTAVSAVLGPDGYDVSYIYGIITVASSTVFEIRHQCETTGTTSGFGLAANLGISEVYTQVDIERIE